MKTILSFAAKYFLRPFENGIIGYLIFFLVLSITKLFSYAFGYQSNFKIESGDVLLSLVGFVLFYLIKILENSSEERIE